MFRRAFIWTSILSLFALEGLADPMRTLLTRENKFPELSQLEGSLSYVNRDWNGSETEAALGEARIGFHENMTFRAELPLVRAEKNGSTHEGIGDLVLGLELLAFEDIFHYPFIVPHVDVSLDTGDEDDGTGYGETVYTVGFSVGTMIYDQLTFVVDASYLINGTAAGEDDTYQFSGSIVWDISPRFAVLVEGQFQEENEFDETPYRFHGGMVYNVTPDVSIGAYGGQLREDTFVRNTEDFAQMRLSVTF